MEGLFTILQILTSFFLISPLPEHETFLSPDEKALLLKRLEEDILIRSSEDKTPLTFTEIVKTMTPWKVILP